ncbi:uncharacterized protein PITG_16536 [Phytophthora infestans T30-4]|uniref:Uncharacterized protein n=1 Tax=Phytophthora infestans (strain T30-4) TaxID=403677 RepID=D0NTV9_PHYIT|nr:uncharacterized protein PITG_16536 [Phytophthora infestans T30-4]EEY65071.1 conserved hypothetical protein [Phytophthora infestans T30-4]|eukprot:XP_002897559.1 conserved hypothetical protein [Phytophthora infestans T30-4]
MLLTLVLWIDAQLERYRSAVIRDIDAASSTRFMIPAQFTSNNPSDNYPLLPQQDGKEVCFKFISKKGCPSGDQNVCIFASRAHFYPAAISDQLRNYLRRMFGGVHSNYK